MTEFLKKAKESSYIVSSLSGKDKNRLLSLMAAELINNSSKIIEENKKDMQNAKESNLSKALQDRLYLDENRIYQMAQAITEITTLKEPVGRVLDGWITEDNLKIEKVSVPIGVIGVIYESRPNVTSDVAALCLKSGNVAILKGGKEAFYSNSIIANILQKVLLSNNLPKEIISLLPDNTREGVSKMIKEDKYIDLIIPRGGEQLIRFVNENSSVPVVKHDKGLCHIYIDAEAKLNDAQKIVINAKVQRPGVCNAVETLLVNSSIAHEFLPKLEQELKQNEVLIKGCEKTQKIIACEKASEDDWNTEYLDKIISIKIIDSVKDAINHINKYGSGHSDSIITQNYENAEKFLNEIDSACVYLNASTRFTDGGAFGFGAEVGISTNKLHSRGPMGINDLTTYKFKIYGKGNIRE